MISRAGNRSLQLLILNEEFLVSVIHQITLIKSLSFVHTARRSYRLNDAVKSLERTDVEGQLSTSFLFSKLIKPSHLEEGEVVTDRKSVV